MAVTVEPLTKRRRPLESLQRAQQPSRLAGAARNADSRNPRAG